LKINPGSSSCMHSEKMVKLNINQF